MAGVRQTERSRAFVTCFAFVGSGFHCKCRRHGGLDHACNRGRTYAAVCICGGPPRAHPMHGCVAALISRLATYALPPREGTHACMLRNERTLRVGRKDEASTFTPQRLVNVTVTWILPCSWLRVGFLRDLVLLCVVVGGSLATAGTVLEPRRVSCLSGVVS